MMSLLIAATIAGQTPVEQMVDVCRATMDSQVGRMFLAFDRGPPFDEARERRRRSFGYSLRFEASRRGLDVGETESLCWAMVVTRIEGQREGLGFREFVLTKE